MTKNFERNILSSSVSAFSIVFSLLVLLLYATHGPALFRLVAIALAVAQLAFSARCWQVNGGWCQIPMGALYVIELALFIATPFSRYDTPLRLVQVGIVAIALATGTVLLLCAARLNGIVALALSCLVPPVIMASEIVLAVVHGAAPPANSLPPSQIIEVMRDIAGPAGIKVAQDNITVLYQGDPHTTFQEAAQRDEKNWLLRAVNGDRAVLEYPYNPHGAVRVNIQNLEQGEIGDLQVRKERLQIKPNTHYSVSLRARADASRRVEAGISRAHGDWAGFQFYVKLNLTHDWQNFSFDWISPAYAADDNACIFFNLGGSPSSVEIASVRIRNLSDTSGIDSAFQIPGTYPITYDFNGEGCRAGNFSAPKAAGTKRILILGNSFVLGAGIPDGATLSARMQAQLNGDSPAGSPPYQVINCGQAGYGTRDERLFYELLGSDYHPDLVLLGMTWRDDTSVWEEMSPPEPGRLESMFFSIKILRGDWNTRPHTDFTRCVREVKELDQAVQRRGSTLALFIFRNNADYAGSTDSGKTWNKFTATVTDGLRGASIPILDTGKVLKQGNAEDLKASADIPQDPNETAHAIAARELLPFLRQQRLVAR